MTAKTYTKSALSNSLRGKPCRARHHKLQVCEDTGLARYRDRHQARDAARAQTRGSCTMKVNTFACPSCRGFHLEEMYPKPRLVPVGDESTTENLEAQRIRPRRYALVDIENLTQGAKATASDVYRLWELLKRQAPGFSDADHIVIGAARRVARKYRGAIQGDNVKWVVGADAPDGADTALLAAIDLYRVARDFDEVVIVSGDHAFARLARRADAFGLRVHVVSAEHYEQRTMLSRELAKASKLHTTVRLHAAPNRRPAMHDTPRRVSRATRSTNVASSAA